ncbi:MAG TPA: hypothetical protein PLQ45_02445 [Anaerohalosphaeraceae bacterium]|nr:hypothetical protein [Anaerohalosphaeraceae bacterium]
MDPNNENRNSVRVKNWFTWALLALLPGLTGWFIVLTQEQIQQNRSETYKPISTQYKEEFLRMYQQWSQLTPQEKADNPWGTDPYGGPEIQKKLHYNQEERLQADLPELLSENTFPSELGDILYGTGWRGRVEEYQKQIGYREIMSIFSWILVATGVVGFGIGLVLWAVGKASGSRSRDSSDQKDSAQSSVQSEKEESDDLSADAKETEEVHLFTRKRTASSSNEPSENTDSPSPEPELVLTGAAVDPTSVNTISDLSPKAAARKNHPMEKASLAMTEILAEEAAARKDSAIQSLMTPEPVALELTGLTEQMSAIREFAAEQQSQVKKLQDGYDWMLIKRFCLRIIRCIDNVDDRIRQLRTQQKDTSAMEDIRDEMVFALESSGVEPYEPDIGRPYRGLEKYAEAIKDRKENENPEKSGTIAEIVRPGYQYLISDEEVKIVRCAQVKLYA